MKKFFKVVGYVFLGLIAVSAWSFWQMDGFKQIGSKPLADCRSISGNGSAEDIQIDEEKGLAYISSTDRMAKSAGRPIINGAIAIYDLNNPAQSYATPSFTVPADFRPHGLSLFIDKDGSRRLFVINHLKEGGQAVEIFAVDGKNLQHLETIKHPLLVSPNDLVAVGPRQFYVGNDSGAKQKWQKGFELMGLASLSSLTYFDGSDMRIVASDYPSAGGINISKDGQWIFGSGTSSKTLEVYSRNAANGDLRFDVSIPLAMAPDNVDVAADGSVWIAGHPKTMALIQHFISAGKKLSPSMIERIQWTGDAKTSTPELMYSSDGSDISASSISAPSATRLLIGGITPLQMLDCARP